jgi:hypothetical protein
LNTRSPARTVSAVGRICGDWIVLFGLAIVLAGCGSTRVSGSDGRSISSDDADAAQQVVAAEVTVFADASCASTCQAPALRKLQTDAHRVSATAGAAAARVSDPCLRHALTNVSQSLRSMDTFATALLAGSEARADAALKRAANLRTQTLDDLVRCGYVKRGKNVGLEANVAMQSVASALAAVGRCETDACQQATGRALARAARLGRAHVAALVPDVDDPCVRKTAVAAEDYLAVMEAYGVAIELRNAKAREDAARLAPQMFAAIAQTARGCVRH